MPELPEVETVANALRPYLVGRRIMKAEVFAARLRRPLSGEAQRHILKQPIVAVRRRAKYIIVEFQNRHVLLLHLGMSGSCRVTPKSEPRAKHEHVVWQLDNGLTWRFNDPRRFGLVEVQPIAAPGALPAELAGLPPEPLEDDFTADYLLAICHKRERPIKLLLMDHTQVAGVGNIYASEALLRAGIKPTRRAGKLTRKEAAQLVRAIQTVLRQAIRAGGTTISDFVAVDGSEGKFHLQLRAYGRENQTCLVCKKARIRKLVMSGRSTYYCPACQK
jgi:formamidopyrimidine-DNA glycosylase